VEAEAVGDARSVRTGGVMREKPILFSAPMVRAILAGKKTQTRRILPAVVSSFKYAPGTRLWVKETWQPYEVTTPKRGRAAEVRYDADGTTWTHFDVPKNWRFPKAARRGNVTPLFMPRWASRIMLEITSVRVERLLEITEGDAIAEGVNYEALPFYSHGLSGYEARIAFAELWDAINGKRAPWSNNPWVWVVEFRRIEAKERAA
jgi:hypothetical protein